MIGKLDITFYGADGKRLYRYNKASNILQISLFVLTLGVGWLIFYACGVFDDKKPEQKVIDNKVIKDDKTKDKTPSNQQQPDLVSKSTQTWQSYSKRNNINCMVP